MNLDNQDHPWMMEMLAVRTVPFLPVSDWQEESVGDNRKFRIKSCSSGGFSHIINIYRLS